MAAFTSIPLATADENNLFGYSSDSTSEGPTQASCTENAVFSKLRANIIAGGSGTNNFQFRDAGANGSQLATRAGAGVCEDTVNTDTLTAGDLFNIAYTDTGSNSTISWMAANIEFASGYGAIQGAAAYTGVVFDVASATRFIGLAGDLAADGEATEANVGFKVRGYTTFEALQVRVSANARTNDSVFRNRINSANGTGTITFAAAETGLKTALGLADAITAGQIINASITLGTGVEDLTVRFVATTLKSTSTKQDVWSQQFGGTNRAASATANYVPIMGFMPSIATTLTEAETRMKPGFAGTASNLRCYLSANTYTVFGTLILMKNGVAAITLNITALGGAAWYENTSDTVAFDDDDEFSLEFDEGTSGNITIQMAGLTLAIPSETSVALTGVSGTGGVGTLVPGFALAASSVVGTGAAGSLSPSSSLELTGISGTGSLGALAPSSLIGLTGVGGSGFPGDVNPAFSASLEGLEAIGETGLLDVSFALPLGGVEGIGFVGDLTISSGDITLALTGVEGTGELGTLIPGITKPLIGLFAVGRVGTLYPGGAIFGCTIDSPIILTPQILGGTIQPDAGGYFSNLGNAGITMDVTISGTTLHFEDGILVAVT